MKKFTHLFSLILVLIASFLAACGPDEVMGKWAWEQEPPEASELAPDGGTSQRDEPPVSSAPSLDTDGSPFEEVMLPDSTSESAGVDEATEQAEAPPIDDENTIQPCAPGHTLSVAGNCQPTHEVTVTGHVEQATGIEHFPPSLKNVREALLMYESTPGTIPAPESAPSCEARFIFPKQLLPVEMIEDEEARFAYGESDVYKLEVTVGGYAVTLDPPTASSLVPGRLESIHQLREVMDERHLRRQTIQHHSLKEEQHRFTYTTLLTFEAPLTVTGFDPSAALAFYSDPHKDFKPFFLQDAASATIELIVLDTLTEEVSQITCTCEAYAVPPERAF